MHYWIVEHDIAEHRTKEHARKREEINEKFIGTIERAPAIVVQGVEIKKPSWFVEASVDLDQLTRQIGGRRNR